MKRNDVTYSPMLNTAQAAAASRFGYLFIYQCEALAPGITATSTARTNPLKQCHAEYYRRPAVRIGVAPFSKNKCHHAHHGA